VQNRVFNAPYVLIDRKPVSSLRDINRLTALRICEAQEVPGRVDEGIQRVGFTCRIPGTNRAVDVLPGWVAIERVSRVRKIRIVRQKNR
jgi:hypothetical protein